MGDLESDKIANDGATHARFRTGQINAGVDNLRDDKALGCAHL